VYEACHRARGRCDRADAELALDPSRTTAALSLGPGGLLLPSRSGLLLASRVVNDDLAALQLHELIGKN
jgi:hypothetical protein